MKIVTARKQGLLAKPDQRINLGKTAVIDGRGFDLRSKSVGGFDGVHEIAEQEPFSIRYGDDMDEV